ncbi:hypothetical protein [Rhodococcus wratislaviensis]
MGTAFATGQAFGIAAAQQALTGEAAHFRADAWPTGTCCPTSTTPACT